MASTSIIDYSSNYKVSSFERDMVHCKYYVCDQTKEVVDKACGMYDSMRDAYGVLVGRRNGNRPPGRPKCK
jgi:hypothetical protein